MYCLNYKVGLILCMCRSCAGNGFERCDIARGVPFSLSTTQRVGRQLARREQVTCNRARGSQSASQVRPRREILAALDSCPPLSLHRPWIASVFPLIFSAFVRNRFTLRCYDCHHNWHNARYIRWR